MKWYLRACPHCHGDLHEDLEDVQFWTCFMCTRSFRKRDLQPQRPAEPPAWRVTPGGYALTWPVAS